MKLICNEPQKLIRANQANLKTLSLQFEVDSSFRFFHFVQNKGLLLLSKTFLGMELVIGFFAALPWLFPPRFFSSGITGIKGFRGGRGKLD